MSALELHNDKALCKYKSVLLCLTLRHFIQNDVLCVIFIGSCEDIFKHLP